MMLPSSYSRWRRCSCWCDDGDALDDKDDLDDGDELDDGDDKLFDKIMSDMFCVPVFVICLGQVKYVCVCVYSSVFFFFWIGHLVLDKWHVYIYVCG